MSTDESTNSQQALALAPLVCPDPITGVAERQRVTRVNPPGRRIEADRAREGA